MPDGLSGITASSGGVPHRRRIGRPFAEELLPLRKAIAAHSGEQILLVEYTCNRIGRDGCFSYSSVLEHPAKQWLGVLAQGSLAVTDEHVIIPTRAYLECPPWGLALKRRGSGGLRDGPLALDRRDLERYLDGSLSTVQYPEEGRVLRATVGDDRIADYFRDPLSFWKREHARLHGGLAEPAALSPLSDLDYVVLCERLGVEAPADFQEAYAQRMRDRQDEFASNLERALARSGKELRAYLGTPEAQSLRQSDALLTIGGRAVPAGSVLEALEKIYGKLGATPAA